MQRAIVAFELDGRGEWVAELACGHRRHVRHRPPFFPQPWILEADGREERLGTPLDCRVCDQDAPAQAGKRAERRHASYISSAPTAESS